MYILLYHVLIRYIPKYHRIPLCNIYTLKQTNKYFNIFLHCLMFVLIKYLSLFRQ